jgi:hypothetical protein
MTSDPLTAPAEARTARRAVVRVALVGLVVFAAVLGFWAGLFPQPFYDSFPGFGRQWVAGDGPFNEHLVRDVGYLSLALGVVTVAAAVWLTTPIVQATAIAWLVFAVPHLTYHVAHFHEMATVDVVGNAVSLGGAVVLALVVLVAGWRRFPSARFPNARVQDRLSGSR